MLQTYYFKGRSPMETKRGDYRSLIEHLPDAFAYHQVTAGNKGSTTIDCIFLDVNQSFEKLTGLSKNEVIGKKAKDVLSNIDTSLLECTNTCTRVAITGKPTKLESFSKSFNRWYEVSTYSDHYGRPYKRAMSKKEIIAEFKRYAGTQFDPELVEIFLNIFEEDLL